MVMITNMMKNVCMFITQFLSMVRLGDNGDYLHRYFIFRSKRFNVVLHRFLRSDADRELHNHMWPGFSVILSGRYREEKMTQQWTPESVWSSLKTKVFRPGMFNSIGRDDFHRVDLLTPEVWTLFFYGRKVRDDWGFMDRDTLEYTAQEPFLMKRDGFIQKEID